jgi:DNA-binding CsgD family transcriptional regulator
VHDIANAALQIGVGPDELRPFVERVGWFTGNRLPDDHPWRSLLEAQLAEAEGDVARAATLFAEAAACADGASGVLARPRGTAPVGAARCRIAGGDHHAARAHAIAGGGDLVRWRGWRVDELRAVERRLGLDQETSGAEALTPREREVVALLAEGLTNAVLAERLYISPRTAAVHVSNILAKLGMASRTEVAAWAVREGYAEGR